MALAGRTDDSSIGDDERLWRRVPPVQVTQDPQTGKPRPSSAAFHPSDQMSVDIASLTCPAAALAGYPEHGLAEFRAGDARKAGCIVVRDPLPDNRAHALVLGKRPDGRLTPSQGKQIATRAVWAIPPPRIGAGASPTSKRHVACGVADRLFLGLSRLLSWLGRAFPGSGRRR